jgi:5S rRNA maturation endonuclease (ribonuclease M5)
MIFTTEGTLELTKENILKQVSEIQLWRYYTDTEVRHGKHIKGDTSAVFYIKTDGTVLLKDFAKENYNIWTCLMKKYNKTFYQVLQQIVNDFKLNFIHKKGRPSMNIYATETEQQIDVPENITTSIRIKKKHWTIKELDYWLQYGISQENLKDDNCYSLDHYWIIRNDMAHKFKASSDNPIFCWDFGDNRYKIYRPYADKGMRWINNIGTTLMFGENDVPTGGDLIIISKSGKDRLVLKNLGYTAVAVQGENNFPAMMKIHKIKMRFTKVAVFFDDDEAGNKGATRLTTMFSNFKSIVIPKDCVDKEGKTIKDISDYYKECGKEKTENLCKILLETILI